MTAITNIGPATALKFHPLADVFPLMDGSDFAGLVEDVRQYGVREPVVLYDGLILDGRNRYRAATEAGVDCPMRQFDDGDPAAFVVSINLKRRHLNENQRAMVAAKLANLPVGRPSEKGPIGSIAVSDAASMLNVGERSVKRAKSVQRDAVPELVESVERGEVSVSAAATVAKLPVDDQREIVEAGPDAVKGAAREMRTITERLDAGDEELRARLREQLIEAAKRGSRYGAEPASRKNPLYRPNPARDVLLAFKTACEKVTEVTAQNSLSKLLASCYSEREKDEAVAMFSDAYNGLKSLLEKVDV